MKFFLPKNQSGQGLLELVVAIGVISVGLFSVWNLFISNFNGEQEAGARILATNLAREGVEVVKNIRDSNWLAVDNNDDCSYNGQPFSPCFWDSGLSGENNDNTAIIKDIASPDVYLDFSPNNIDENNTRIYLDSGNSGLYVHNNSGQATSYHRLITINSVCCNDADTDLKCDNLAVDFEVRDLCLENELKIGLDVKSTVTWMINGHRREISIQERLFNWK